jgi:hypothetical protein
LQNSDSHIIAQSKDHKIAKIVKFLPSYLAIFTQQQFSTIFSSSGDDVESVHTEMHSILTTFNDDWEMVHDLKLAHQKSYIEYVCNLLRERVVEAEDNTRLSVAEKITEAFTGLDEDMSKEAIENAADDEVGLMTSTVALSGAVAVLAHIEGPMLHVASTGDCVAVLGIPKTEDLDLVFVNLLTGRVVTLYYLFSYFLFISAS